MSFCLYFQIKSFVLPGQNAQLSNRYGKKFDYIAFRIISESRDLWTKLRLK